MRCGQRRVRYNDGYAVALIVVKGLEIPTLKLKPFQNRVFPVFDKPSAKTRREELTSSDIILEMQRQCPTASRRSVRH
jgi:hypothetical protein